MRKRKILAVFLVVFSVMLSSFAFYGYQILYTPNFLIEAEEPQVLTIERGTSFQQLQQQLDKGNYVNDLMSFSFLSKILGYDANVQPGHYTLQPDMANLEVIKFLRRGNPPVRVSFQSVRKLDNLSAIFGERLYADSAEWSQYFRREEVQEEYGMNRQNLIGLFMPDTYEFYYKATPEEVMQRMHQAYKDFWNAERKQKAQNMGMTPQEVTTLASIVQAETAMQDEASRVAGVYKNRLDMGMRLQADPTLIFAKDDFSIRRVRKGDKEVESPYNTYKYKGLPPGPINMPSRSYIDATLNYEDHDYLYFCARADFSGYHAFAESYRQHMKNAYAFQQALDNREIYR